MTLIKRVNVVLKKIDLNIDWGLSFEQAIVSDRDSKDLCTFKEFKIRGC